MKLLITAVGKIGRGPEAELTAAYLKKNRWNITLKEINDAPAALPSAVRKQKEAAAIVSHLKDGARLIALDGAGEQLTSPQFAKLITDAQRDGVKQLVFASGGQDGLDLSVLKEAHRVVAFGKTTWPHKLVRAMLAEQLYRAYTITIGHPYHDGH